MRGLAGLAIALLTGTVALGGDLNDPVWTQAPGRGDWAKAYPTHAAQAGISGSVKLRCAATDQGSLSNCAVMQETPSGEGFAAAAMSLSSGMQLRATAQNGQPVAGRYLVVPVKFDPEVLQRGVSITNPDWVRVPSEAERSNFSPITAGGRGGRVVLGCKVSNRGLMEQCAITSEQPSGLGLGGAALALSAIFVMRPMTIDGTPVGGGSINIPIAFQGNFSARPDIGSAHVLRAAPWSATPTADEMAAAFPRRAAGKVPMGHVVLRCAIRPSGALADCDAVSEEPRGYDFAQAARSLTRDFRVIVDPKVDKLTDLLVDVPFDFEDAGRSAPLEITDPLWLRSIDPGFAAEIYPPEAAKTGVTSGVGMVACTVAHDGTLKDCGLDSESPPNLGFGAAAIRIAGLVAMNPWTAQGTPVDGARVHIPIRLKMPDEPAPAQPAPATPAKP